MNAFGLVICDLDGTLADTALDLACAINETRKALDLEVLTTEKVVSYVGNGMRRLVERAFSDQPELIPVALKAFYQHYQACQTATVKLYPGVQETVETLFARGVHLAVLTNKAQASAEAILDYLGLGQYFGWIYGDTGQRPLKPDPAPIRQLLSETGLKESDCLLVGDSGVDVECAQAAGITCAFIEGGMGRAHPTLKPKYTLTRIDELLALWD